MAKVLSPINTELFLLKIITLKNVHFVTIGLLIKFQDSVYVMVTMVLQCCFLITMMFPASLLKC